MIKKRVKSWLKRCRLWYDSFFFSFDTADFENALVATGIQRGDALLVHSSYDAFSGFRGKPTDVILALQRIVGSDGVIMMPTMPFTGTALEYVRSGTVFDVRRTPSRMGLLTELFRRSDGVVRSLHPTHPIAIWGQGARAIAEEHRQSRTPCGSSSPFEKLLRRDGKILLLGTGIGVLTFFHFVEEYMEDVFPFSPFGQQIFTIEFVDAAGKRMMCESRLFDPAVSRRRNLERIVPELKRAGEYTEYRVGRLKLIVLKARDVLEVTGRLAGAGIYPYD
jgi:aminoglycoside 3-N-acetyltransferase